MSGRSVYVTPQNMPSEEASMPACVRCALRRSLVRPPASHPWPRVRRRRSRRVIKRRSEFRMRFPDDPRSEKNARTTDGRRSRTPPSIHPSILPPSLARCHFIAVARRRAVVSRQFAKAADKTADLNKCPTTLVHPRSVPFRASSLNNSQRIRGSNRSVICHISAALKERTCNPILNESYLCPLTSEV